MSRRLTLRAMLLLSWLAAVPSRLSAQSTEISTMPIAQSDATTGSPLAEPVVLLLLGLLLATVGILVRRSSEKRLLIKSRASRDV